MILHSHAKDIPSMRMRISKGTGKSDADGGSAWHSRLLTYAVKRVGIFTIPSSPNLTKLLISSATVRNVSERETRTRQLSLRRSVLQM